MLREIQGEIGVAFVRSLRYRRLIFRRAYFFCGCQLLRLAVFLELECILGQASDVLSVLVENDHRHQHYFGSNVEFRD